MLSKGQVDAVRLAGGEWVLVQYASRSARGVAALAAMLAGVVALSDPGPGQILGYPGVATQVLTSFSALYDFGLAARQALALAGIVLLITLPLAWLAAPRLASGLLARDVAHAPLCGTRVAAAVGPLSVPRHHSAHVTPAAHRPNDSGSPVLPSLPRLGGSVTDGGEHVDLCDDSGPRRGGVGGSPCHV